MVAEPRDEKTVSTNRQMGGNDEETFSVHWDYPPVGCGSVGTTRRFAMDADGESSGELVAGRWKLTDSTRIRYAVEVPSSRTPRRNP